MEIKYPVEGIGWKAGTSQLREIERERTTLNTDSRKIEVDLPGSSKNRVDLMTYMDQTTLSNENLEHGICDFKNLD